MPSSTSNPRFVLISGLGPWRRPGAICGSPPRVRKLTPSHKLKVTNKNAGTAATDDLIPAVYANVKNPSYNSRMAKLRRCWVLLLVAAGVWAQAPGQAPLTIVTKKLPPASLWTPYSADHQHEVILQAAGGVGPRHWRIVSGSLPHGIELDEGSGMISGRTEESGQFEFTILVSDKVQSIKQNYALTVETPLTIEWHSKARVSGNRIDGSVKVSNQTGRDFDLTFIVLAVNDIGRATAIGYQHFHLQHETRDFDLPFGETLSPGNYVVNVDVVGEEPISKRIFRARLVSGKESIAPTP